MTNDEYAIKRCDEFEALEFLNSMGVEWELVGMLPRQYPKPNQVDLYLRRRYSKVINIIDEQKLAQALFDAITKSSMLKYSVGALDFELQYGVDDTVDCKALAKLVLDELDQNKGR